MGGVKNWRRNRIAARNKLGRVLLGRRGKDNKDLHQKGANRNHLWGVDSSACWVFDPEDQLLEKDWPQPILRMYFIYRKVKGKGVYESTSADECGLFLAVERSEDNAFKKRGQVADPLSKARGRYVLMTLGFP